MIRKLFSMMMAIAMFLLVSAPAMASGHMCEYHIVSAANYLAVGDLHGAAYEVGIFFKMALVDPRIWMALMLGLAIDYTRRRRTSLDLEALRTTHV